MSHSIAINKEQRLFVLSLGPNQGFSCLGFDVVFKRLREYAKLLSRPAPRETEIGTQAQYTQYREYENAFIRTNPQDTLFDPETPDELKRILEQCRTSRTQVRVFYGDRQTGRSWLDEYDMVGHVGRSCGPIKTLLLVPRGDSGGPAMLTHCVVRLMNAKTGKDLWRHPSFHVPDLAITENDLDAAPGLPAVVVSEGSVMARFASKRSAQNWISFMNGQRLKP